jgi:hypothetical protein
MKERYNYKHNIFVFIYLFIYLFFCNIYKIFVKLSSSNCATDYTDLFRIAIQS